MLALAPRVRWLPVVALLSVAACSSSSSGPQGHPTPATPPVITESFTPLPCNQATTVGQEGCAERAVLRADALVNREVHGLWLRGSPAARAHLVTAQTAWLAYRSAVCTSEADAYAGGSLGPVTVASCLARIAGQRSVELARQASLVP